MSFRNASENRTKQTKWFLYWKENQTSEWWFGSGSVRAPHLPGKDMKCWQGAFQSGPANKDGQNRCVHKAKIQTCSILASSWLCCARLFALLLSQMCYSCGYVNKTQPNYAQASFLNFIGLWDVWSGKTQPVQIEQQMEAARGNSSKCWAEADLGRAALGALRSHWVLGCSLRDVRRKQCAEYTRSCGECRATEP